MDQWSEDAEGVGFEGSSEDDDKADILETGVYSTFEPTFQPASTVRKRGVSVEVRLSDRLSKLRQAPSPYKCSLGDRRSPLAVSANARALCIGGSVAASLCASA